MKVKLYNQTGQETGQVDLPARIFDVAMNVDLVHQAVVSQQANSRSTIAHTKDRGERKGGGKKPWRQKGTGRARHGSNRSPIWRKGGVTFGPTKEKNYAQKINKKMKQKALFMCLSSKVRDDEMVVVDKLEMLEIKTKKMVAGLKGLAEALNKNFTKSTLIVIDKNDKNIVKSASNIDKIKTTMADKLNVLDILNYQYLILVKDAISVIDKHYIK